MGVLFSKPKKPEEPRTEEPRSRSNSTIGLQNVNMREPGANENQSLLQKNLNQNLNSGYESTVVAIPTERNTQVAKNPKAENYFLSNEAVWDRVFSFCSTTDLLKMRLISRCFPGIIQDYNQDDHVFLLRHIISFISITRLFSLDQGQAVYILFSGPPTAIRRTLITNPFISHNQDATHISELCILLRDALKRGSLFPISSQNVKDVFNSLSNIENNIQIQHLNKYGCCCEKLLASRDGQQIGLTIIALIMIIVVLLELFF